MVNPDFADWIRCFGGHGERVETTAEFGPALSVPCPADGWR